MVIIILLALGLALGSFINALVWRLHENKKDLSIWKGRSICVHCNHVLAWYDLIPVLSWLFLKGKCRYCKNSISVQYPAIELLTAGLFVWSYLAWSRPFTVGNTVDLVFWLVLLVGFIALAVYDLRWMLLPNKIVYPLLVIAMVNVLVVSMIENDWHILSQALLGGVFLGGLFYLLFQVSKGKWIGGGDVKLGAVLGLTVAGLEKSILTLFLASLVGTIVALPLLVSKQANRRTKLPFGPFLIVGAVIAKLYGADIIGWYNHLLLIG